MNEDMNEDMIVITFVEGDEGEEIFISEVTEEAEEANDQ